METFNVVGPHFLFVVLLGRYSSEYGVTYGLIHAVVRLRL